MPIGKKIYNVLSKKWDERSAAKRRAVAEEAPAEVNQAEHNVTVAADPVVDDSYKSPIKVSPGESTVAVNGEAGPEVEKKYVTKVEKKTRTVSPGKAAAIKPQKKTKGRPRKNVE